ncbi:hypothetical protein QBC40DRAFT_336364 [Triangularia verruculosa]|uniref:Ubiquitin carboxyl-terminal hydrolase n=1 Tax=Triangularia verruculosa TaxID=2587418 RepID=A0AAN6XTD5_9PEZI|nr:hypothetical protein QBC40DRAFT_336364 [Triangularia verruculosa]
MAQDKKRFIMLENNPEVFTTLAHKLGLPPTLTFHDIYSLDPPDLSHIPRPCLGLVVIIPLTPAWDADRKAEDARLGDPTKYYHGNPSSPDNNTNPIIWFEQTIGDACGSYALLHCAVNGPASELIQPGSAYDQLRKDAASLLRKERAQLLYDNQAFEDAHNSVAAMGDTAPVRTDHLGQHFVGYVKANGRLWELEGCREGPLDRGELGDDEDVLSPRALELGLGRIIKLDQESGGQDLRFSCIALAPRAE